MSAVWLAYQAIRDGLTAVKTKVEAVETQVGTMVTNASRHVESMSDLWGGPLPDAISSGASYYVSRVSGAAEAAGSVRELLGGLISSLDELIPEMQRQQNVLESTPLGGSFGEVAIEEFQSARRDAYGTLANLQLQWQQRCARVTGEWESTISGLTDIINSVAFAPPSSVVVPSETDYLTTVAAFSARSGVPMNEIDLTGGVQARADALDADLRDTENNWLAAVTYASFDIGRQGDPNELNGDWSHEDLIELSENPERAELILRRLDTENGWELSDEQIVEMASGIRANAWLIRADQNHDWGDLDDDRTFGDWFKTTVVGPAAGVFAGVACGAIVGVETFGAGVAGCAVVGGEVARGVDTLMEGGDPGDALAAATDPRAMATDAMLGWGTYGLFELARGWYLARPATTTSAPSVWSLDRFPRGLAVEDAWIAGQESIARMPRNFPVIDAMTDDGVVVSVKSMDLMGGYSNPSSITSVINSNIRKLARFEGANFSGMPIDAADILGRELLVVVPPGYTHAQQVALEASMKYAADRGVVMNIVVMP